MQTRKYRFILIALVGSLLFATACSKGPEPPQPGSPAFNWAVAKDSYKNGDYAKTNDTLEQMMRGKHEFSARVLPWKVVMAAGAARGYSDLADRFETGGKAARNNPGPFRKQSGVFRNQARTIGMQAVEAAHKFLAEPAQPSVALAFPFPAGELEESPPLKKVTTGMPLQASEVDKITREMIQRGVLQIVSRAAGSPKDAAKAKAAFTAEETQIPREQYLMAVATALYEISDVFTSQKLDEPDKVKTFCEEATQALEGVKASKEKKDLTDKIQKALKKAAGKR